MSDTPSIITSPEVQKLKTQLNKIVDEYLMHDGWGHFEMDMKILTRHQKEVILRAGREYRFVIDFK